MCSSLALTMTQHQHDVTYHGAPTAQVRPLVTRNGPRDRFSVFFSCNIFNF